GAGAAQVLRARRRDHRIFPRACPRRPRPHRFLGPPDRGLYRQRQGHRPRPPRQRGDAVGVVRDARGDPARAAPPAWVLRDSRVCEWDRGWSHFILRQAQDEALPLGDAMKGVPHAEPVEARTTGLQPVKILTTSYQTPAGRLFAVEAGGGAPVICLHGITANAYVWLPVMERLAADHRVVAIDQRGHGRSDRPASGYAAGDFAADIVALIEGLGAPAIVIGHSLGARNALAAAIAAPDAVAAVVAIDFVPFIEEAVFSSLAAPVAG